MIQLPKGARTLLRGPVAIATELVDVISSLFVISDDDSIPVVSDADLLPVALDAESLPVALDADL